MVSGSRPLAQALRPLRERIDVVTWLSVYVLVLFGVPSRLVVGPLGSAGAVSMLLGLLSLGFWGLLRIGGPRPGRDGADPVATTLFAFLFSVGVSYALAMGRPIMPDEISPADVALLSLLSWTGTFLIAREVPNSQRRDTMIWRLTIAGGLLAILGMAQFFTRRALVDLIAVPGLTAVDDATAFFRDGRIRPSGTSIHPLEYGTILSLLLPFALHVAFRHNHRNIVLRWLPALAIGGVIAISSSRTAYLTAVLGVVVAMIGWSKRQRIAVLGLGLIGVLSLAVLAPRLVESATNLFSGARSDPSIESRTDSFAVAWHFIALDPLFGRGLGTFLGKYRIFDNQYLLLLVSVGVIGTVLFASVLAVAIIQPLRVFRRSSDADTRALAMSLSGSIVAGALGLAFFDAFAFPMTMGSLFLVMGISTNLATRELGPGRSPASRPTLVDLTFWDLASAARRQWIAFLLCIALSGSVGWLSTRGPSVNFARMEVLFLAPTTWYENVLQGGTEGAVMTAGAVARRVAGTDMELKYGSMEATLVGISHVSEGYWIRAEDRGGQWTYYFRQPIILVDVVAPTPERVREIQLETIDLIQDELNALQDELRVVRSERVVLEVAPELSIIYHVRGNKTRALGMTLFLGSVVTTSAAWLLDGRSAGADIRAKTRGKKAVRP